VEFCEKLQELRKSRGLTQEELAEALYVSRTAVSKWESGRGYPSIDSLKEISAYFSVTIDELLSGEKLISVAEKENKSNLRGICGLLFGMTDILALMLVLLPLYPKTVNRVVYSVNLFAYTQLSSVNRCVYWAMFAALVLIGAAEMLFLHFSAERWLKYAGAASVILGIAAVMALAMAGETYAVVMAFSMLLIKGILILKCAKAGC